MLASDLRIKVEEAVQGKIQNGEPFTTAHISHPIIEQDPSVRHRHVRRIIHDMDATGQMDVADYVKSPIQVAPDGDPITVNLWHPDGFDPSTFDATLPALHRTSATLPASSQTPRGIDMSSDSDDDDDVDDQVPIISNISGAKVSRQCTVQNRNPRLNVPRYILRQAGFDPGDHYKVTDNHGHVTIKKAQSSDRVVEADGRIRINSNMLPTHQCTAMLVQGTNGDYIHIQ